MLESGDEVLAKQRCALELHGYEQSLQPEIRETDSQMREVKKHYAALHGYLWRRQSRRGFKQPKRRLEKLEAARKVLEDT